MKGTLARTSSCSRCAVVPVCLSPRTLTLSRLPAPVRSPCRFLDVSRGICARARARRRRRPFRRAQHLLLESRRIREPGLAGAVHEALLMRYAAATHRALLERAGPQAQEQRAHGCAARSPAAAAPSPASDRSKADVGASGGKDGATRQELVEARLARVRRLASAYTPTAQVWAAVFAQEAGGAASGGAGAGYSGTGAGVGDARVVEAAYEQWRRHDGAGATSAWAAWLLRSGRGREAIGVVARARSALGEKDGLEVERRWKAALDEDAGAGARADRHVTGEEEGFAVVGEVLI